MKIARHSILILVLAWFASGATIDAQANDPVFDAPGVAPNRDYFSELPFEHIDTATGGLTLTFTDLVLPGNGGLDLVFQHSYSSKTFQWTFGLKGIPLIISDPPWPDPNPDLPPPTIFSVDGMQRADTPWFAAGGIVMTDRFWKYYRGSNILWKPDGSVGAYDASGRITTFTDSFGNVVSFAWAAQELTITQNLGNSPSRTVVMEWPNTAECVTGVGAPGCVPTLMTYDERTWRYNGTPLSEIVSPTGSRWQFAGGYVVSVITPSGGHIQYTLEDIPFLTGRTPGEQIFTRVVRYRDAFDVRGSANGRWQYDYEFVGAGLVVATRITKPDGSVESFFYKFISGTTGSNGAAASYEGRTYLLTTRTVVDGGITLEQEDRSYKWVPIPSENPLDALPELEVQTFTRHGSSQTYKTTYSYNPGNYGDYHNPFGILEEGQITRRATRTYQHSAGAPANAPYIVAKLTRESVTLDDVTFFTRSWGYDGCPPGNPGACSLSTGFMTAESIHGITTTFASDGRGNIAAATKANGKSATFNYFNGRVSQVTTPGVVTTMSVNPDGTIFSQTVAGRVTGFTYDELGRQKTLQVNGNYTITNDYDNVGGEKVTTSRGPSSVETTLDGFGRPISTVNGVGVRTETRYDASGRTSYQSLPYVEGEGAGNVGTGFVYDGLGRVRVEALPDGHSRTYEYVGNVTLVRDEEGRRTQIERSGFGHPDDALVTRVIDAEDHTWTYAYNAAGNLTSMSGPGGVTRTWGYQPQNPTLLASETHPESGTVTYSQYDAAGVLKQKTDAKGTVFNYGHDGNDRLTSIQAGSEVTTIGYENGSDNRVSMSVTGGASTVFTYDTVGRARTRTDTVDGRTFAMMFDYDPSDILRRITYPSNRQVDYGVDNEGRITSVINPNTPTAPYAPTITPHPSGAIASYRAGNNLVTQTTFNPHRYWVSTIGVGPMFLHYTYDNVGNVRSIADSRPGMDQEFTYDDLDRLQTATSPVFNMQFAYDAHGNRQTASGTTYTYQSGNPFRLQSMSNGPGNMQYDPAGNLTSASGITMTYTPSNLLQSTTVSGGPSVTYGYDADTWRVKRLVNGGTTVYYLRDPSGRLLTEWENSSPNATVKDYVYAGSRLIAVHTSTSLAAK